MTNDPRSMAAGAVARPGHPPTTVDPITLTVVQNALIQTAAEMDIAYERSAFSPVISEGKDRASGIYDPHTGEVVAQGPSGLPIFIGAMQFTAAAVIRARADIGPGDVFMINDPYLGGTHLQDVKLVRPFFHGGRLFAFLANTGHWPDIGGIVPGSYAVEATEIHQEGMRIPPVKLVSRGQLNEDILSLVLANIRVAEERRGDVAAQLGALSVGERQLTAILDKYGTEVVAACMAEIRRRSSALMREFIATIPAGTYSFEDYMDSDGVDPDPLRIALDLTVKRDEMIFDFSRSSPPCRGPMNGVWSATLSAVYIAMKHLAPDFPINAGCFEPLTVIAPDTTFLNTGYPKPVVGSSAEVPQRITDVILGALSRAIPERLPAAPVGTSANLLVGGTDPATGRDYVLYFWGGGGHGGSPEGDGLTNAPTTIGLALTIPLEVSEYFIPVMYERYALREASGGAGLHRGGFGVDYRVRLLRGHAKVSCLMDRGRFGPFGVGGGQEGARTEIIIEQDGKEWRPPHISKVMGVEFKEGDRITVRTPGGGGWGDPRRRDPTAAAADLAAGYYTAAQVRERFGTALRAATSSDRDSLR